MRKDIEGQDDIRLLIDRFYEKVRDNDEIGYLFNEVAKVNWVSHLPVMYAFWEQILFGTGNYSGNPMKAHMKLNSLSPMKPEHFRAWVRLFHQNLDELFEGPVAELARQRAASIATVMELKIVHGGIGHAKG
ncbi:MAG: group III truncated hemoglobin [Sphingobacteriales bacterium]|nr:MAG: group III truncated hemoglobin [Sphingobacteriales bacterium]